MSERRRVFSGSPYEGVVGFCRAIRVGAQIHVAGTAPIAPDGTTFAPGDAYRQMQRCLDIAREAVTALGGSFADVVRTRMYVTDIKLFGEVARAHQEAFGAHPPVATMVEVTALVAPDMLVEVEVEAVVG